VQYPNPKGIHYPNVPVHHFHDPSQDPDLHYRTRVRVRYGKLTLTHPAHPTKSNRDVDLSSLKSKEIGHTHTPLPCRSSIPPRYVTSCVSDFSCHAQSTGSRTRTVHRIPLTLSFPSYGSYRLVQAWITSRSLHNNAHQNQGFIHILHRNRP